MWAPNEDGSELLEYLPGLRLDEMQPERPGHDLQTFLFKQEEMPLRFHPYKNELSVMIDQIPLHRDQFIEITIEDVLNDTSLVELATDYYGWTTEFLEELHNEYKELGIGFKLVNPLDRPG